VGSEEVSDGYQALASEREECGSRSPCMCPINWSELPGQSLTRKMP